MTDAVLNTDRELYRVPDVGGNGDYYLDRIHVTQGGSIGINVGGLVIVKPLSEWHELAQETPTEGWQPIETAPIGEQRQVLAWPVLAKTLDCTQVASCSLAYARISGATHWMSLPEPPKGKSND